ncbi:hypothetical protein [Actinoplanes sp. TFC3]|uniref:hypothetical protein n=1 Tax=Actinoplanes sp. TFC3 TaxID=1710355 RepID=UPI000835E0DE|nr:hypothetical protein [Actinoplanes sp. TFC3]
MDVIPDRDLLHARAVRRVRGLGWMFAVIGVLAGAAMMAGVLAAGGGLWWGLLLPLIFVAIFGALAWRMFRRADRDAMLFQGADRATQRSVSLALKAGGSDDPRIDALARDLAERSLRRTVAPWAMTGSIALVAVGLLLNLFDGKFGFNQGAGLIGLAALVWVVVNVWQTRARSRRYLAMAR